MSVRAVTWAFDQRIAGNEKVVLLCLADHFSDETAQCWPSIGRLVQRACVSKSTVLRCIASLEAAGYITVEGRTRDNGGITSNLYRLRFDRVSQDVSGSVPNDQEVSPSVNLTPTPESVDFDTPPSVTRDTPPSVTGDTPIRTTIKNHQKEPVDILSDVALEAAFEEFWAAYPKRPNNPKRPAFLKYVAARRRLHVPHETLLTGITAYAATRSGEDPLFTTMAVTWLNQRRWEEYAGGNSEADVPSSTDIVHTVQAIKALYPGTADSGAIAEVAALMRAKVLPDDLVEAAEKYKLWVSFQKSEGVNLSVPALSVWLKFRWRDMSNYVFCYRGMTNKKSVKLKKGNSDEDSARIAG